MNDTQYTRLPQESEDEYLFRLGKLKETYQIDLTWTELAIVLNHVLCPDQPKTESSWRKKYKAMCDTALAAQAMAEDISRDEIKRYFTDVEKQRVRARDERRSYQREVRSQARLDELLSLFEREIKRYPPAAPRVAAKPVQEKEQAMYVLLSDLHYGLSFHSVAGKYNADIAKARLQKYVQKIKQYGVGCAACYVSIMGDLISGSIHPSVRIENKETLIEQVVGAAELIAEFLFELSSYFEQVTVNCVSGNHSRPDPNLENTLRKERLDALIPWYCKAKLSQQSNIHFVENVIDDTVGSFTIFNKLYVCVHGDMEKDLKVSAHNIGKLISRHVDFMLSAHTHVAEYRFENTRFIVNGSVCGSGDDYTMRKRLFGPPVQVCMECSADGVEAIHPVELGGE